MKEHVSERTTARQICNSISTTIDDKRQQRFLVHAESACFIAFTSFDLKCARSLAKKNKRDVTSVPRRSKLMGSVLCCTLSKG